MVIVLMWFCDLHLDVFRFQIELKFEEPFYGRAYADFDRSSACMVTGKGNNTARIDLPLKGCGTRQVRGRKSDTIIKLYIFSFVCNLNLCFVFLFY